MTAWDAILSASPVVQLTLLILVGMSVVCWAVIFMKRHQFRQLSHANEAFLDVFWRASSLESIYGVVDQHPKSSVARVFRAGYLELRKIADSKLASSHGDEKDTKTPLLKGIDNLDRALRKGISTEVAQIESRLGILATTGSTGPFIGLFGTVWGIMGAFQKIGITQSASLAVVAPGISEALVATAIGLAAAIPATMAYNVFVNHTKRQEIELDSFSSDFLNIAKRNFFRDH